MILARFNEYGEPQMQSARQVNYLNSPETPPQSLSPLLEILVVCYSFVREEKLEQEWEVSKEKQPMGQTWQLQLLQGPLEEGSGQLPHPYLSRS